MRKYLKPKSLTWWAGFIPLVSGLIVAWSEATGSPLQVAAFINSASGGMTAAQLINTGLIAIGLRGAIE